MKLDNQQNKLLVLFKKVFLFVSSTLLILILVILFSNFYLRKIESNYQIRGNIENLILEHSHAARAYNDSIIPNTLNMAQPGDSYFYMYLKARQLIKSNPKIRNVYVEYTNNLIDIKMDEWIWSDIHLNYKFRKLSAFAMFEDHLLILKNNPKGYFTNFPISVRKNLGMVFNTPKCIYKEKNWGGFEAIYRNNIDSILLVSKQKKGNDKRFIYRYSDTNIKYLIKLIDFLKVNNINIYLIRTPQHEEQHFFNNEGKFQTVLNELHKDITFLDFKNYPMYNKGFADFGHLNNYGALEFSNFIMKLFGLEEFKEGKPDKVTDSVLKMLKIYRSNAYIKGKGFIQNLSN
jgi:hypothetical protein